MSDNSTFRPELSERSADTNSVAPSASGSDAQTRPDSTEEADHTGSVQSGADSGAESEVEDGTEERKAVDERLGAMMRKLLDDFDSEDPARREAILAATRDRAKTHEEERKNFEERMTRLSGKVEGQPLGLAEQLDLLVVDLFMTGKPGVAIEGCRKDEKGDYLDPRKKSDK